MIGKSYGNTMKREGNRKQKFAFKPDNKLLKQLVEMMINKIIKTLKCQICNHRQQKKKKEIQIKLNKGNKRKLNKCQSMKEKCKKSEKEMKKSKENRWKNK